MKVLVKFVISLCTTLLVSVPSFANQKSCAALGGLSNEVSLIRKESVQNLLSFAEKYSGNPTELKLWIRALEAYSAGRDPIIEEFREVLGKQLETLAQLAISLRDYNQRLSSMQGYERSEIEGPVSNKIIEFIDRVRQQGAELQAAPQLTLSRYWDFVLSHLIAISFYYPSGKMMETKQLDMTSYVPLVIDHFGDRIYPGVPLAGKYENMAELAMRFSQMTLRFRNVWNFPKFFQETKDGNLFMFPTRLDDVYSLNLISVMGGLAIGMKDKVVDADNTQMSPVEFAAHDIFHGTLMLNKYVRNYDNLKQDIGSQREKSIQTFLDIMSEMEKSGPRQFVAANVVWHYLTYEFNMDLKKPEVPSSTGGLAAHVGRMYAALPALKEEIKNGAYSSMNLGATTPERVQSVEIAFYKVLKLLERGELALHQK
ncbi:MAG: hypothetical protein AB7F59_03700 [Bdellovibrionales bacterium]